MRYDDLAAKEAEAHAHFAATLGGLTQDAFGYTPGAPWGSDYFYAEQTPKRAIVLHFTMGVLSGDIATLTNAGNQGHVSVSFVAARNGNIYRLFEPENWSYHLGPGSAGGNPQCSAATIGIEMSNLGPLHLDPAGATLVDAYNQPYCTLAQTDAYSRVDTPYRGYSYFATFTAEQYQSVAALLQQLAARFDIPLTMLPEASRYQTFDNATATSYRGVCSHVNFRPTGKTDIGPAFEWDQLGLSVAG
jgi:N-acetylmuramoyl-L-alanine amidase